jgi:hypothetical protein
MLTHQNMGFYLENCLLAYSDMNMCSCFGVENFREVFPAFFDTPCVLKSVCESSVTFLLYLVCYVWCMHMIILMKSGTYRPNNIDI